LISNEVNNDYFIVERSANGTDYLPVVQIKGNGTSQGMKEYIAFDEKPNNGLNYYRLIQYDLDGNKKLYGIRVVRFGGITKTFIQLYPNPANSFLTILTEPDVKKATITITDALGRAIKTFMMPENGRQTIQTNELVNGIYYIRLSSNGEVKTSKIIINNK
jgi:hypothetical protein